MKYSEFKDLSKNELAKKLKTVRADLVQAKMKNSLGQLANPVQIRFKRKDAARIMTAMSLLEKSGGDPK